MQSGHVVRAVWRQIHRAVQCAVPADAAEDVQDSGEEASGTVYQDRGAVTRNETGDGELARKTEAENRQTYTLVNNRSEGNVSLTVKGRVEVLHG